MKHAIFTLLLAATLCHGQGSTQTLTVTFEGPPAVTAGGYLFEREYYESGVWFRTDPPQVQFERRNGGPSVLPDNGTTYLAAFVPIRFSFVGGTLFDLVSVDLAEFGGIDNPATVRFIGYRPDNSIVMTEFTTDGLLATEGLADFETFNFGPEFSGLTLLEIPDAPYTGYSLDNLVIAIPEPAGGAMLMAGGILLGAASRFWNRNSSG